MKPTKKPFFAYRSFWKEFDAMKRFAQIGVRQFVVFGGNSTNSLGEPYCQYDSIWKWHDTYDFAPFDEQMNDVLRICPDAEILCMIDLNSPLWLARQLHVDSYAELSLAECNELMANLRHLSQKGEMIPDVLPKLIDQKEAAVLLGVSYTHFRNLERQNTFPFKRRMVGTAVRYRNTDVIEYLLNLPEVEPNENE